MSLIWHHQTCGHIERRRLAGTIRSQQSYYLSLCHFERDIIDDSTLSVYLDEALCAKGHLFCILFHICQFECKISKINSKNAPLY